MGIARKLALIALAVVAGVISLNIWLEFTEHRETCSRLKEDAQFALQPGKPCSDFEQRMRLEGTFLRCKAAEKMANTNINACAARRYLSIWLPTRVGATIEEHYIVTASVGAGLVIAIVYILVNGLIHDRAHQRTVDTIREAQYRNSPQIPYHAPPYLAYHMGSYDQVQGGARLRIEEVY